MLGLPLRSSNPDLADKKYIAAMFGSGEQGAWYDPSDFSTMYQDAAGTIPVTNVEQPVGLMLDKSKGLMLGAELVVNGEVNSSISGWQADTGGYATVSWNAGSLRVTSTSTVSQGKSAYQAFPVIAGKWYVISGSASIISGSFTTVQISLRDGTNAGLSSLVIGTVLALTGTSAQSTYYYADSTRTLYLHARFYNSTAPAVVDFDNISVRELPGNHAKQTTTASRPTLQIDTAGNYFLSFDGVDDWMVTPSIDFTATDKMTVMAGVRKLSDAATATLFETSSSIINNNGTLFFGSPTSTNSYQFNSKGSSESVAGSGNGVYVAPITNVVAGISDISGDSVILRVNGNQVAQSTADQGTGNYGNFPLYIGRRNGASLPFKGRLYGLIVRGAATDDSHLTHAEKYLAYKSGVSL